MIHVEKEPGKPRGKVAQKAAREISQRMLQPFGQVLVVVLLVPQSTEQIPHAVWLVAPPLGQVLLQQSVDPLAPVCANHFGRAALNLLEEDAGRVSFLDLDTA